MAKPKKPPATPPAAPPVPVSPPSEPSDALTVIGLEVDSYARIRTAHLVPSPVGLVPVRGKNKAGKSSLIGSMIAALGGKKDAVELPITEGQHAASVVMDLGEIVVKRRWTRDSAGAAVASLVVEAADGSRLAKPQDVLDSLRGHFADPVAFIEMKPIDQAKTVLRVLGLDERLAALEAKAASQFETRRDLGRDAERLTKVENDLATEIAGIPSPVLSGTVDELAERLEVGNQINAALDALAQKLTTIANRGLRIAGDIDRQHKQIAELKAAIVEAEQRLADLEADREAARVEYKATKDEIAAGGARVDTTSIRDELSRHREAAEHESRQNLLAQKRQEAVAARAARIAAEADLEATRAEIRKLLTESEFPMGLAYDLEGKRLTVNGVPFSQASASEQIGIAARIAMAGNPRIRVIFARAGSLLDEDAQLALAEVAEQQGFQVWLEIVDSHREGVGVWIEDGVATQVDGVGPDAEDAS